MTSDQMLTAKICVEKIVVLYTKYRNMQFDRDGYVMEIPFNMRKWAGAALSEFFRSKEPIAVTWEETCELFDSRKIGESAGQPA